MLPSMLRKQTLLLVNSTIESSYMIHTLGILGALRNRKKTNLTLMKNHVPIAWLVSVSEERVASVAEVPSEASPDFLLASYFHVPDCPLLWKPL